MKWHIIDTLFAIGLGVAGCMLLLAFFGALS